MLSTLSTGPVYAKKTFKLKTDHLLMRPKLVSTLHQEVNCVCALLYLQERNAKNV